MLTVLIGAPASGKTTVGRLLAAATSRPFIDADEHAGPFYAEAGWSVERLSRRTAEVGFEQAHREWEVALAAAVAGLVRAHPDAVLALGAGHSHLTTPLLFEVVADTLTRVEQVVLLRPAADPALALAMLRERCRRTKGHTWEVDGVDWLARWLTDDLDERLATDIVLTGEEAPQCTAARVAALPMSSQP